MASTGGVGLAGTKEDEWEYEYDETETISFFVDVDMTSLNHAVKPSKESSVSKTLEGARKQKNTKRARQRINASVENEDDADLNVGDQQDVTKENEVAVEDGESVQPSELISDESLQRPEEGGSIQILDLHTNNPIVAYRGIVYSCTWTDMIGTSLFVTQHQELPLFDPEISTKEYDLIGTSHVKLVGNRVKVQPRNQNKKRQREEENEDEASPRPTIEVADPFPSKRVGITRGSNPKTLADRKKQAKFLEQLMDVKKVRGEKDNVKVIAKQQEAVTGPVEMSDALRSRIEQLNRRVVKGDDAAWRELQRLQNAPNGEEVYGEEISDSDDDFIPHLTHNGNASPSRSESASPVLEPLPRVIGTATPSSESSSDHDNQNT